MTSKRVVTLGIVGLVFTTLLGIQVSGNPSEALAIQSRPTLPKLETFAIEIQTAGLDKNILGSALPPRAVVTASVKVANLGMEEKRDVLLRLSLENTRGEIVAETSLLVYVPYQKTNTYSVSLLIREGGEFSVVAEVVSQGRAVSAVGNGVVITPMDLIA